MITRRLQGEVGEIEDIVGRKVTLLRSPGWQGGIKKCRPYYTVKDVYFKISTDGKVVCIVSLEELPDISFTLGDILLYGEE